MNYHKINHQGSKILETERLILRPFTLDDAGTMFRNWASDPEVTKFLTWPTHASREVSEKVLQDWVEQYEKPDCYQWAIVPRELGEPVGSIAVVGHKTIESLEGVQLDYLTLDPENGQWPLEGQPDPALVEKVNAKEVEWVKY